MLYCVFVIELSYLCVRVKKGIYILWFFFDYIEDVDVMDVVNVC